MTARDHDCVNCPYANITATLVRIEDKIDKRLDDHASKISSLENWRSTLVGGWIVLATMLYVVWDYMKLKVLR